MQPLGLDLAAVGVAAGLVAVRVELLARALAGEPPAYAPLADWLDQQGVATIDPTDALVAAARQSGLGAVMGERSHYQPRGNRIVAETLADRLPPLVADTCGSRAAP